MEKSCFSLTHSIRLEGNGWILKDGKYKINGVMVTRFLESWVRCLGHDVLDEDADDNDEHLVADDSDDNEEYDDDEADQSDL